MSSNNRKKKKQVFKTVGKTKEEKEESKKRKAERKRKQILENYKFIMSKHKIDGPCNDPRCTNAFKCEFYHQESDKRRSPWEITNPYELDETRKKNECSWTKKDRCYHPELYKTKDCDNSCDFKTDTHFCAFIHEGDKPYLKELDKVRFQVMKNFSLQQHNNLTLLTRLENERNLLLHSQNNNHSKKLNNNNQTNNNQTNKTTNHEHINNSSNHKINIHHNKNNNSSNSNNNNHSHNQNNSIVDNPHNTNHNVKIEESSESKRESFEDDSSSMFHHKRDLSSKSSKKSQLDVSEKSMVMTTTVESSEEVSTTNKNNFKNDSSEQSSDEYDFQSDIGDRDHMDKREDRNEEIDAEEGSSLFKSNNIKTKGSSGVSHLSVNHNHDPLASKREALKALLPLFENETIDCENGSFRILRISPLPEDQNNNMEMPTYLNSQNSYHPNMTPNVNLNQYVVGNLPYNHPYSIYLVQNDKRNSSQFNFAQPNVNVNPNVNPNLNPNNMNTNNLNHVHLGMMTHNVNYNQLNPGYNLNNLNNMNPNVNQGLNNLNNYNNLNNLNNMNNLNNLNNINPNVNPNVNPNMNPALNPNFNGYNSLNNMNNLNNLNNINNINPNVNQNVNPSLNNLNNYNNINPNVNPSLNPNINYIPNNRSFVMTNGVSLNSGVLFTQTPNHNLTHNPKSHTVFPTNQQPNGYNSIIGKQWTDQSK